MLIKNAEALELLEKVDTLVVDKTGTLTEGKPQLVSIEVTDGWSDAELCASPQAWSREASTSLRPPLSPLQQKGACGCPG